MKKKYLVYGSRATHDSCDVIKTFKNESDAIGFITSDKNAYQYGDMILKHKDSSGVEYIWNDSKRVWEAA